MQCKDFEGCTSKEKLSANADDSTIVQCKSGFGRQYIRLADRCNLEYGVATETEAIEAEA